MRSPFPLVATLATALGVALSSACSSQKDEPAFLPRADMLDPVTCQKCHADHFREWSGSMHAYAAEDPVFLAMNKRGQRETNGALGDFCVKCHAPMAVREGATKDGLNLADVPAKLKGVTCFFCHSVDGVEGTHDATLHLSSDLVMRGPFADPVANTAHRATYSALHDRDKLESSGACGACHDIVNGHGAAIERTFIEWQASVFAHAPGGATCSQCHMAQSANLEPVAQAPNVFARRRHAHTFAGVDTALTPFAEADAQKKEVQTLLDGTLQSALCVSPATGQIRVMMDNVAAGHEFPSGATQDRRAWVELVAYAGGAVVYQSGTQPTPVSQPADADLWLLRECMFDDKGSEVHMFWEGASTEGNALPAQATFDATDPRFYQTHVVRSYPRQGNIAGAIDRVTMRVRLQAVGLDVLDELIASGDLDPALRGAMPTLDLGAPLEWTASAATETYAEDRIPFTCVSKTGFAVQADKVPAPERTRCTP
jgi:hypothetical protein